MQSYKKSDGSTRQLQLVKKAFHTFKQLRTSNARATVLIILPVATR